MQAVDPVGNRACLLLEVWEHLFLVVVVWSKKVLPMRLKTVMKNETSFSNNGFHWALWHDGDIGAVHTWPLDLRFLPLKDDLGRNDSVDDDLVHLAALVKQSVPYDVRL